MEVEFEQIDRARGWTALYQKISECENFNFTYKEAKKVQNKDLNRYRNVSPYDHSRVKLDKGDCDYINANLVTVPDAKRSYILTQGPLPHTTSHFWQMVWEQKSKAVLMLNKIIEKNTIKCHQYWPLGRNRGADDVLILPDIGLRVEFVSEVEYSFYTLCQLRLTETQSAESRLVLHFHYTTWPDFGVPQSPGAFLTFLFSVRRMGVLDENVGPPVVHCSAGIGRSGTFCLADSCLVLIEKYQDMNRVKILDILIEMRRYRMGLIQTPDQLRFSYIAIIEGAKQILGKNNINNSVANNLNPDKHELVNGDNKMVEVPEDSPPPLPCKTRRDQDSTNTSSDCTEPNNSLDNSLNNSEVNLLSNSETELRRRIRQERLDKTKDQIETMKKKQQACERRRRYRSSSPRMTSSSSRSPAKRLHTESDDSRHRAYRKARKSR